MLVVFFSNSIFDGLNACKAGECPNSCSGHGSCKNGSCVCVADHFGTDCSYEEPVYEQCRKVDQLSGNVGVRMKFTQCYIVYTMVLEAGAIELPLYSRNYSISQFRTVFQNEICAEAGCTACIKWQNLTLTQTTASGCGVITFKCFGIQYKQQSLGCFKDDNVVPRCFGTCPNSCSFHGICDKGKCICDMPDWTGTDCSTPNICMNNCSAHGICKDAVCVCNSMYRGVDCSVYIGSATAGNDGPTASSSQSTGGVPVIVYVIIPVGMIVLGALIGGLVWRLKKKKVVEPTFHQLDLIDEDDTELREN